MAKDKKKKGEKGSRVWLLLAVLVGMFLVLVGIYYARYQALPFGGDRFVEFIQFWKWVV